MTAPHPAAGDYPRFSDAELARRRTALEDLMAERGLDHLLLYGADRSGSAVAWLTGWPPTREAAVLIRPGARDLLLVQFYNHVPLATRIAAAAEVRWGGAHTLTTLAGELPAGARLGVIGPLTVAGHRALADVTAEVVLLDREYVRLRQVKSDEEVAWLRRGAELSDAGLASLVAGAGPGTTEHELADLVERGYVPRGGTTHIHYFGATSMADPDRGAPAQLTSARPLAAGDVLMMELSAAWWGYAGQVLRTWTVAADPTPLYRDLHDAADAAFADMTAVLRDGVTPAELVDAAGVIEDAGFTTLDDLVHGFGGGYLPPVFGSRSRQHTALPEEPLRAGMTVVVQPNVVTPDLRAGVQTGELVLVTRDGWEPLHTSPRGLARLH
jgi:Xaa-Pro dipeptidase